MSAGRIDFGPDGEWGAYSQSAMLTLAAAPDVSPAALRVLFAALGRHDPSGHAAFGMGELRHHLACVDRVTGEVLPMRADTLSAAIESAKRLSFVLPESTARCLVLSPRKFQKAKGRTVLCGVHP